ncbi:DNA topology modulation protein FlaR [Agrobacterium rhizogenes]|nr:DNA topology modulation protein FlaR [Rhizobium rhizogenes]NTJ32139.1 DNA topology modulation protein FlaR [Rhizobium rhizogenes]
MQRLIVTGPNGAGKSYLAAQLAAVREVPVISFDAIKLTTNWKTRSREEINAELLRIVQTDQWVLEGGPSLLPYAIQRADGVVWLDPTILLRAWRLGLRPLRHMGKTRPELPEGNGDWPLEQYKFAIRSLRNHAKFRRSISEQLSDAQGVRVWHVRNTRDIGPVIDEWRYAAP